MFFFKLFKDLLIVWKNITDVLISCSPNVTMLLHLRTNSGNSKLLWVHAKVDSHSFVQSPSALEMFCPFFEGYILVVGYSQACPGD